MKDANFFLIDFGCMKKKKHTLLDSKLLSSYK